MKKVFSLLTVITVIISVLPLYDCNVYASDDVFSTDYVEEYISENKADIISIVSGELDNLNQFTFATISGQIDICKPFSVPTYRCFYNDVKRSNGDVLYSIVSSNNQAIGLLKMIRGYEETSTGDYESVIYPRFYYISENSSRNISDGAAFFYISKEDNNISDDVDGGVSCTGIYSISADGNISAIYYKCDGNYSDEITNAYENTIAIPDNKVDYRKIADYNNSIEYSEAVISFQYEPTDNIMKTGSNYAYYIRNKSGKYLTYQKGKFILSERLDNSNSQKFAIIPSRTGGDYTIRPIENMQSTISFNKNNNIIIRTSYFNEYCYVIGTDISNKFTVMTACDNGKVITAEYHSDKHDFFKQDWLLEYSA